MPTDHTSPKRIILYCFLAVLVVLAIPILYGFIMGFMQASEASDY